MNRFSVFVMGATSGITASIFLFDIFTEHPDPFAALVACGCVAIAVGSCIDRCAVA